MSIDPSSMTPEELEAVAIAGFSGDKGMSIGPMFMGVVFDVILYGVMIQQFQTWWQYCRPTERKVISYVTHYIMVASTAWTCMVIAYAMHSFVYNFGVYRVFLEMTYFTAFPLVGFIMSSVIQCFYIDRSYRLNNRNKFLLIFLLACILGEVVSVVLLVVKAKQTASLLQAAEAVPNVRAWQCMTLGTDVVITVSLAWGLYGAKTGWSHTDALVKKLILLTLETQLGPTLVMLGFVIELSISPSSGVGIFFDIMIPKAYTVGYLATLNTRVTLRREAISNASRDGKQTATNAYHLGSGRLQQATVQVDTETYIESFQMQNSKPGLNRVVEDGYEESIENLDYANNLSKRDLNKPSQNF